MNSILDKINELLKLGYRVEFRHLEGQLQVYVYVLGFKEGDPAHLAITGNSNSPALDESFVSMSLDNAIRQSMQHLPPRQSPTSTHPYVLTFNTYELDAAKEPVRNSEGHYEFHVHMRGDTRRIAEDHVIMMQTGLPARLFLNGIAIDGKILGITDWKGGIGWTAIFSPN
jgi:hypothetical protein